MILVNMDRVSDALPPKSVFTIATAVVLLIINGCASHKYGESGQPTQKSNLTFGVVKSNIQKGVTTQQEILQLFGSPNLITKNRSNDEVWSYNKMSVQEKGGKTYYWTGQKASSSTSSQSFDLIITFSTEDIVKEYSVISTNF